MSEREVEVEIEVDQTAIEEGESITANVINQHIDTIFVATAHCSAGPDLPAYRSIETGIEKETNSHWKPVPSKRGDCNNPVDLHRAILMSDSIQISHRYEWFNDRTELEEERNFRFSKRIKTSTDVEVYSRVTSEPFKVVPE